MANIPIDAVFNQTVYAKSRVNKLAYPGGTVIGVVPSGSVIGKIYSYILHNGKVYWMIDDLFGTQSFFVEHNGQISLPNKQAILDNLARKAEAQKAEDKGIIQYNIDKYLPWLIGGGIAVVALPTILNSGTKINGMSKNKNNLLLAAAAAAAIWYFTKDKKTRAGVPTVEVIDEGFVPEMQSAGNTSGSVQILDNQGRPMASAMTVLTTNQPVVTNYGGGGGNSGMLEYLGPFKAEYSQTQSSLIAGKKKGDLGRVRTC